MPHRQCLGGPHRAWARKTITVADMPALVRATESPKPLYLIARVVVFKDNQWASAHTQWAVHRADGSLWRDGEDVAWIDPFQQGAWDRSLALAEEAAQMGFDEINSTTSASPMPRGWSSAGPRPSHVVWPRSTPFWLPPANDWLDTTC